MIFDGLGGPDAAVEVLRRRRGLVDPDPGGGVRPGRSGPAGRATHRGRLAGRAGHRAHAVRAGRPAGWTGSPGRSHTSSTSPRRTCTGARPVSPSWPPARWPRCCTPDDVPVLRRAAFFPTTSAGSPCRPRCGSGPAGLRRGEWESGCIRTAERILAPVPLRWLGGPDRRVVPERQGGGGYHRRAAGAEVPVPARLLAAADMYQALTFRTVRTGLRWRASRRRPWCCRAAGRPARHRVRACRPGGRRAAGTAEPARLAADWAIAGGGPAAGRRRWSNPEIARELVLSPRTAGHHVQHIYAKIGVSTGPLPRCLRCSTGSSP